jgi:hypothetical protein
MKKKPPLVKYILQTNKKKHVSKWESQHSFHAYIKEKEQTIWQCMKKPPLVKCIYTNNFFFSKCTCRHWLHASMKKTKQFVKVIGKTYQPEKQNVRCVRKSTSRHWSLGSNNKALNHWHEMTLPTWRHCILRFQWLILRCGRTQDAATIVSFIRALQIAFCSWHISLWKAWKEKVD